ncbi:DnaJ domain-containing protein [Halolamina sp. CBA1230]|uniref:ferredoxin Fer n=1 Tax=Halolamina sp. CBA1230 TaxID=1853690 RepID=UPI0009A149FD|nr:ferredoxin Fer [Halolamina sp. CBA1230]QKY19174.1 DnaJ domain-containing protein [Halolamina sp. CBA1230]
MDPFDVLGVETDADDAEISRAYRQRVKETHPDQGGSRDEFMRVQQAYAALRDGNVEVAEDGSVDVDDAAEAAQPRDQGPPPGTARMEYLDFEVLGDYGWEIDDDDLFEVAAEADLAPGEYGRLLVDRDETLLEAAERCGFAWPYACRGGACANCAVLLREGEVEMADSHVLPEGMVEEGIRLSCLCRPRSDELQVVYNVKHLPGLDELRLPSQQF